MADHPQNNWDDHGPDDRMEFVSDDEAATSAPDAADNKASSPYVLTQEVVSDEHAIGEHTRELLAQIRAMNHWLDENTARHPNLRASNVFVSHDGSNVPRAPEQSHMSFENDREVFLKSMLDLERESRAAGEQRAAKLAEQQEATTEYAARLNARLPSFLLDRAVADEQFGDALERADAMLAAGMDDTSVRRLIRKTALIAIWNSLKMRVAAWFRPTAQRR